MPIPELNGEIVTGETWCIARMVAFAPFSMRSHPIDNIEERVHAICYCIKC